MSRIVHFEIPADNLERGAEFYRKVFGWKFQKWAGPQDYWLITTGPTRVAERLPQVGADAADLVELARGLASYDFHGNAVAARQLGYNGS